MGFQPLHNFVAIRRDDNITRKGSILLAKEQVSDRGIVVAIGPKVDCVVPGEHVLFKQWQPNGPKLDGVQLTIVKDTDLMVAWQDGDE